MAAATLEVQVIAAEVIVAGGARQLVLNYDDATGLITSLT